MSRDKSAFQAQRAAERYRLAASDRMRLMCSGPIAPRPCCPVFAGAELDEPYVTCARERVSEHDLRGRQKVAGPSSVSILA